MHICRKNIPNCTDFSFTLIFTDLAVKGIFHLKKHRLNLIFLILKGYGIAHFDQIVHNPLNIEFFVWNYVPKDLESRLHKGPWFAASGTLTGGPMGVWGLTKLVLGDTPNKQSGSGPTPATKQGVQQIKKVMFLAPWLDPERDMAHINIL